MNISLMDLLFSFTALLHKVVKLETGKKGVGLVLWNFINLNAKISYNSSSLQGNNQSYS